MLSKKGWKTLTSVTYTGCKIWGIELCITEKISVISSVEIDKLIAFSKFKQP
jgi:hypothetical protein